MRIDRYNAAKHIEKTEKRKSGTNSGGGRLISGYRPSLHSAACKSFSHNVAKAFLFIRVLFFVGGERGGESRGVMAASGIYPPAY